MVTGAVTAALEAVSLSIRAPSGTKRLLVRFKQAQNTTDRKVSAEWERLLSSSASEASGDADREIS